MSVLRTRCAFLIILIIFSLSLDIFEHIHTCILTQHPSTSLSIFNQGQTTTDLFPSIFSLTHFLYFYLFHIREKFFM